jgi:hypothetical protein
MEEGLNSEISQPDAAEHGHSLRRAGILTAAMGIIHAVLFLAAVWLITRAPGPQASYAELSEFYSSDERRVLLLAGLYVMPFAAIAFLWFVVALRMWIAHSTRRVDALLSNVQLLAGIIYIALFLVAAAASSSLAASVEFISAPIDPTIARQFPQFSNTLTVVLAMRMAAMFVFTTSNIGRASKILPRWFAFAGFVVGLFLLLSASISPFLVLVFPIWVLTLSVILLLRARQIPADALLPAQERGG